MALIEMRNFSYRYPLSEDFALKNINLSVEKGEFLAVVGKNGGGKTTLCNAIRGFVPLFYKGDSFGEVIVDGEDLKNASLGGLAVKIGYIFQNPFNQISYVKETVFDEIAYGLENLGVDPGEIRERAQKMIDRLGIGYIQEKNPFELSGGQQQRVALASILVMEPEILVIDEPTSQLDPQGTEQVFEIIDLAKKEGKTIILVEHKIDMLARYADRACVMDGGRIVLQGSAQEIFSNQKLQEYGVPMPTYARIGHRLAEYFPVDEIPITEEAAERLIQKLTKGSASHESR